MVSSSDGPESEPVGAPGAGARHQQEHTEPVGGELRPVRVLIVDDHDLYRTGLASLLSSQRGIDVVGQASSARAGVRLAGELAPDVVLMDLRMPDLSGTEAARLILEAKPELRVVALTVATDDETVSEAMEAGMCGFLTKDVPIDQVALALRAASQGTAWLSPRAAEVVLGRLRRQDPPPSLDDSSLELLTPRELEVLGLIARGMENAEIAAALEISPPTAKNHVSSILSKLGLPSRVQAAIYAVRRGLA